MNWRFAPVFLIFLSTPVFAGEDCVFDEGAYIRFIQKYRQQHKDSEIKPDGKTLVVRRNHEIITVTGGGCVHLGESIKLNTRQQFTQEQFLEKTLELATEFGDWLINTKQLKKSIQTGRVRKIDGTY